MTVKIELKNIHTNERLSEETNCYSADLYVNGKKVGTTGNRGCGGCDEVHLSPNCGWTEKTLNDAVKVAYPKWKTSFDETMIDTDLEMVCGDIVGKHMALKSLKRLFKTKIVCLTDKRGEHAVYSYKGCKALTQAHWDAFNKHHPELKDKVLNLKSDEELVTLV